MAQRRELSFVTTRWSVVLAIGDADHDRSDRALEELCGVYWYSLFSFARVRGHSKPDAEDLTQGFFVHLIQQKALRNVSRHGGRFRSFLLVAFKNYIANQHERRNAVKRGGGTIHVPMEGPENPAEIDAALKDCVSPDLAFDRAWAMLVLSRAQNRIRSEYESRGRGQAFIKLVQFLPGERSFQTRTEAAGDLGVKDSAFRMELMRMKKSIAEAIRCEVADTVHCEADLETEVRSLLNAFG